MLGAFEHQLVCFLYMPYEVHPLHFSSIFVGGGCEPVEKGWELGAGVARISGQSAAIPTTRLIRHDRNLLKKNHESFFFW